VGALLQRLLELDRLRLELGVEALKRLAHLLLARDVARDLRRADDGAGRVEDRRDAERDVDDPSILRESSGLEMLDPLAAYQLGDDRALFVRQFGRKQLEHRLTEHLGGGVAV